MKERTKKIRDYNRKVRREMMKARTRELKNFIIFLLVTILFISIVVAYYYSKDTLTVTVSHRERVNYRDGGKYLIWTENETFQNTDTLLFWKWNSSDLYGKIKEGHKYKITVVGWRIPFLSTYRNVLNLNDLNPDSKKEN